MLHQKNRELIPTAQSINPCPGSGGDGAYNVELGQEAVPGLTAGLDDGGVVVPDLEAESVLAEILPDVLDRVELGAVGRQRQERNVGGHLERG